MMSEGWEALKRRHKNRGSVETDHQALVWMDRLKDTNARLTRWSLLLQSYYFLVEHRKGLKNGNAVDKHEAFYISLRAVACIGYFMTLRDAVLPNEHTCSVLYAAFKITQSFTQHNCF